MRRLLTEILFLFFSRRLFGWEREYENYRQMEEAEEGEEVGRGEQQ